MILKLSKLNGRRINNEVNRIMDILRKQNSETSNYIISNFEDNSKFLDLSQKQTQLILRRDEEDGVELQKGVDIGINRGSLSPLTKKPAYHKVNVLGKSPAEVCQEILAEVSEDVNSGSVIVVVGNSGTGKGTTVAELSSLLPNCRTWSNGNIFRCFTLLSNKHCARNGFEVLSEHVEKIIPMFKESMLFDPEKQDIRVLNAELDLDFYVEDVKNTLLKTKDIGLNIPLVAGLTQGEAVSFAKDAISLLKAKGNNILLEGRQQTVDFIESENRFELILSDPTMIGKRRIAQVISAKALNKLDVEEENDNADVLETITQLIETFEL
eukprot:maker-scaffold_12-snap-gene-9.0-mRNA-1 protein AED:0.01 eAED:0.01 QI:73/1/1/1/1/1/2/143/324